MTSPRVTLRLVATALVVLVSLAACGPGPSGTMGARTPDPTTAATQVAPAVAPAQTPTTAPTSTSQTASSAPGAGGDAWCQSIVAMTGFMTETDSLRALAGTAVPDGPARAQQLQVLVADMRAKAPGGHDGDWVILDQIYDLWAQQLASPTKDRLDQLQTLTTSDAVAAAQASLHDDIVKACPNVKGLGL